MSKAIVQDKTPHNNFDSSTTQGGVGRRIFGGHLYDQTTTKRGKISPGKVSSFFKKKKLGKKKFVIQSVDNFMNKALNAQKEPMDIVISDNEHSITIAMKPSNTSTVELTENVNPFADETGGPKKGSELEFFTWEENKWLRYVNSLPEAERQQYLDAAKTLAEKMDH